MKSIYLGFGGNEGDAVKNINAAYELVENQIGKIIFKSSYYQSQAWGKTDQQDFINSVIEVESNSNLSCILEKIQNIEKNFGRDRNTQVHWGPRTLDVDILFFGKTSIKTKFLTVPHPQIQNRNFVLQPLLEIAPDLIHPTLKLNIKELVDQCSDNLNVWKVNV